MEIDMFVEIHDLLANRTAAAEVYFAAHAQLDEAKNVLDAAKTDIVTIIGGYGFIEGETADLEVALQSRKTINEKMLLALGLTQAQIDSCKVEGEAYKVFRIKPKKANKVKRAA
jgi:hypothetical protein